MTERNAGKTNLLSSPDTGRQRVLSNFVTCTDGGYGGFKNVTFMSKHGNEAGP